MNNQDYESEALIMAKSVKFLRKEILSWKAPPFTCQFPPDCQESSVPTMLMAVAKGPVGQVLAGPTFRSILIKWA